MTDERPAVWVGHVGMTVADPARSHDFFVDAGMRTIHRGDDMAILELRGGTHWAPVDLFLKLELLDSRRFTNGTVHVHYAVAT